MFGICQNTYPLLFVVFGGEFKDNYGPAALHPAPIQSFAPFCGSFLLAMVVVVMTFYQKTLKCVAARK